MNGEKLQQILKEITGLRIGVIGDFCLDAYWFIDRERKEISIETKLEIRSVVRQQYSLGGAGNLVNNLLSIGVQRVEVFGIIGKDPFGAQMFELLKQEKVDVEGMFIQSEHWNTNVYAKPYLGSDEESRLDFGHGNQADPQLVSKIVKLLRKKLPELDAVIINQQVAPGFHTLEMRRQIAQCIRDFPDKLFVVDSRDFSAEFEGACLKVNDREAASLFGVARVDEAYLSYEEVRSYCMEIFRRWQRPVFLTRRERGLFVQDRSGFYQIPGLHTMGAVDTVGAGDSMVAGITCVLAAGHEPVEAGTFGNFVAGITVQKLFQTGTATPQEIMDIGIDPDYVYEPELAEDIRRAAYYRDTEIEIVDHWPSRMHITHAIFDHDGTISTLREGWEQVMEPIMMKAILGDHFNTVDKTAFEKIRVRVLEFIDRTTGIQTISQMAGLVSMVKEFGFIPQNDIQTAKVYKAIYNEAILKLVDQRIRKIHNEELSATDFTIKNAITFLETLYQSGIKLYLASGTDEQDVINETNELGYAHLFEGRIYGSVGDIAHDAKKVVLDRILKDIGESNFSSVITIGDGPVEMRETRKRGGLTIGIASDEIRRFGLNQRKRTRLIRAGSNIIIPDFSQLTQLFELMHIKKSEHAVPTIR